MYPSCSLSLHYWIGHTYTHKPTHTNKTIYTNKRLHIYNYTHKHIPTQIQPYTHTSTFLPVRFETFWELESAVYVTTGWVHKGSHISERVRRSHRKVAGTHNAYYCTSISKTGLAHYPLCVNTVACFKSGLNRHFKYQMMLKIHIK